MNFQEKAVKLKRITTHKEYKSEEVCLQTSLEKVSQWRRRIGRKNPSTPNRSRTYGLLVQMLQHWATGDSWQLRPLNSVCQTSCIKWAAKLRTATRFLLFLLHSPSLLQALGQCKRAKTKKEENERNIGGKRKGGTCKHPSKYLHPPLPSPLHEKPFLVSKCKISKRQIVERYGVGWFHMLSLYAHKGKLLT